MNNTPVGYNSDGEFIGLKDERARDSFKEIGIKEGLNEAEELVAEEVEKGLQAEDVVFNAKNLIT